MEHVHIPGSLLGREAILSAINATPPLIEGAVDLDTQLQPNGFDVTLHTVSRFTTAGSIDFLNVTREISEAELLPFSPDNFIELKPGPYLVTFNEVVNIPLGMAALGRTRSSLLRCGVALHTAVWDAGYQGRSQSLLQVLNLEGFTVQRNARIMQLVFFHLDRPAKDGYRGVYQGAGSTGWPSAEGSADG